MPEIPLFQRLKDAAAGIKTDRKLFADSEKAKRREMRHLMREIVKPISNIPPRFVSFFNADGTHIVVDRMPTVTAHEQLPGETEQFYAVEFLALAEEGFWHIRFPNTTLTDEEITRMEFLVVQKTDEPQSAQGFLLLLDRISREPNQFITVTIDARPSLIGKTPILYMPNGSNLPFRNLAYDPENQDLKPTLIPLRTPEELDVVFRTINDYRNQIHPLIATNDAIAQIARQSKQL